MMAKHVNVKMIMLEQTEFVNQDVPLPTKFGMEKLVFVLLISPNITMPVDNAQLEVPLMPIKLHVFVQ